MNKSFGDIEHESWRYKQPQLTGYGILRPKINGIRNSQTPLMGRQHAKRQVNFNFFLTIRIHCAVFLSMCILFLIKLKWPRNLESYLCEKSGKNIFGSLRVKLHCSHMIWTFHFDLNEAIV